MAYVGTDRYGHRVTRSPEIKGWDAASLAEFDRRYLRGDLHKVMAADFQISEYWVNIIERCRNLPKRIPGHPMIMTKEEIGIYG